MLLYYSNHQKGPVCVYIIATPKQSSMLLYYSNHQKVQYVAIS